MKNLKLNYIIVISCLFLIGCKKDTEKTEPSATEESNTAQITSLSRNKFGTNYYGMKKKFQIKGVNLNLVKSIRMSYIKKYFSTYENQFPYFRILSQNDTLINCELDINQNPTFCVGSLELYGTKGEFHDSTVIYFCRDFILLNPAKKPGQQFNIATSGYGCDIYINNNRIKIFGDWSGTWRTLTYYTPNYPPGGVILRPAIADYPDELPWIDTSGVVPVFTILAP